MEPPDTRDRLKRFEFRLLAQSEGPEDCFAVLRALPGRSVLCHVESGGFVAPSGARARTGYRLMSLRLAMAEEQRWDWPFTVLKGLDENSVLNRRIWGLASCRLHSPVPLGPHGNSRAFQRRVAHRGN